jgi:diadenosine tetraphosphate (Ap4A) HIT family hydrolase
MQTIVERAPDRTVTDIGQLTPEEQRELVKFQQRYVKSPQEFPS